MTYSFNLVDARFIPCLLCDGSPDELGLKETLLRAHEIREVRDQSPVVTITLHRLLLAILHRNFGPPSLKAWKSLWDAGRFDAAVLNPYFDRWRRRFDLFDPERPFYQTGCMTTEKPLPAAGLFEELACNHNPTLFDHTVNDPARSLSFAPVARGLIARQAFALGLGVSPDVTIHGRRTKTGHRLDGPLARGLLLLIRGDNLFQTLLSNLSAYQPSDEDLPVWEHDDTEALVAQGRVSGRVDLYTFQCRRLHLGPPDSQTSESVVDRVHFAQGRKFDKDEPDPMKPYRRHEQHGWLPYHLNPERALWRDSAALFELAHDPDRPVPGLNWLARAVAEGVIPRERVYTLDAFGVGTDPGRATSVVLWRHDQMPLPARFLADPQLVAVLRVAIDRANAVADALARSVNPKAHREDDGDERVLEMLEKLTPERIYWPRLEVSFRRFLVDLTDGAVPPERRLAEWVCHVVCQEARRAFEETAGRLDRSARLLRAVALARERLHKDLRSISKLYKELLHGQNR